MRPLKSSGNHNNRQNSRIFGSIAALLVLSLGGFASPGPKSAPLPNFAKISDVKEKKRRFFNFIRPMAEKANAEILRLRQKITQAINSTSPEDDALLSSAAKKYRVVDFALDREDSLQELLNKVDLIPLPLVLAQAANESGWGTSRFAREGNNLFGQWCFSEGCGLVPRGRADHASHEVQKFDSPYASIASYMHNLNINDSYKMLREIRAKYRDQDQAPNGREMAEGLASYSERGQDYIAEIQAIIDVNEL